MKAATQRETPHIIAREISIHAAREGGDVFGLNDVGDFSQISIHAAREGGDRDSASYPYSFGYFNPRRP